MPIRLCTYNIEWFDRLFDQNELKTGGPEQRRLEAIKAVLQKVKADLIGVVEAPNTSKDGSQSTVTRLETFATWAQLSTKKALIGFVSSGMQEVAILYNPDKFSAKHAPGGDPNRKTNPPFDQEFQFDTDDDRIKELYKFYRPPLEAEVKITETDKSFYLMLVHPKSKGIFNATDMLHWERESRRNRRKLYAECTWVRQRVNEWLKSRREVLVMGDINDGPGMDYHEFQFGRSAVEIIMGDIFEPARILRSYAGRPKWTSYGWRPASTRFKDRFTEDTVNVLIDHILVSQGIAVVPDSHKVWNPYQDNDAKKFRGDLNLASDHFPVTLDLA